MRKVFLFVAVAALAGCNSQAKTETKDEAQVKAATSLPYVPAYSASFKMGNPDYSAMILKGSWKDWENNTMDSMKSWVADTIVALHSDNSTIRGADSLMAR